MAKRENVEQNVQATDETPDLQVVSAESAESPDATEAGDLQIVSDASASSNSVQTARFAPLPNMPSITEQGSMDLLFDVQLNLSVELGRTSIPVRDVLQLGPGSIVELDKLAGEPVDILVNGKLIARGEVVVVDENFGVRVTEIASQCEKLSQAV